MHKNIDNNCTINFKGSHFPSAIIMQAIRWYTSYSLSYRDVEELLEERGIEIMQP